MTATLLADKLLTKLEQDAPFTIKEGEQFFDPTGCKYSTSTGISDTASFTFEK